MQLGFLDENIATEMSDISKNHKFQVGDKVIVKYPTNMTATQWNRCWVSAEILKQGGKYKVESTDFSESWEHMDGTYDKPVDTIRVVGTCWNYRAEIFEKAPPEEIQVGDTVIFSPPNGQIPEPKSRYWEGREALVPNSKHLVDSVFPHAFWPGMEDGEKVPTPLLCFYDEAGSKTCYRAEHFMKAPTEEKQEVNMEAQQDVFHPGDKVIYHKAEGIPATWGCSNTLIEGKEYTIDSELTEGFDASQKTAYRIREVGLLYDQKHFTLSRERTEMAETSEPKGVKLFTSGYGVVGPDESLLVIGLDREGAEDYARNQAEIAPNAIYLVIKAVRAVYTKPRIVMEKEL